VLGPARQLRGRGETVSARTRSVLRIDLTESDRRHRAPATRALRLKRHPSAPVDVDAASLEGVVVHGTRPGAVSRLRRIAASHGVVDAAGKPASITSTPSAFGRARNARRASLEIDRGDVEARHVSAEEAARDLGELGGHVGHEEAQGCSRGL